MECCLVHPHDGQMSPLTTVWGLEQMRQEGGGTGSLVTCEKGGLELCRCHCYLQGDALQHGVLTAQSNTRLEPGTARGPAVISSGQHLQADAVPALEAGA